MEKKERRGLNVPNRENTDLLRIGVVFLSIVSFYTTANGMREYIFINNGPVAYAASAAIQGILLALSMNLPGYLINICKQPGKDKKEFYWTRKIGRFFVKSILCIAAVLLTMVTIFCSSWFSYVYIADVIHRDSWGVDSELLVQQTYRTELYSAQDYAHAYRIYLEGAVGERILLLEELAARLSDSVADLDMDWGAERSMYALADEATGAGYMVTVIDAMEKAIDGESSQETRDLAVTAVADAKTNIENRMVNIQQNLYTLNSNISIYNDQVDRWNTQIARAQEGVDTSSMRDSVNIYLGLINDIVQQQGALQTEYRTLENALNRLSFYESLLGLSSSTSSISIRNNLLQLQSEFFQQEPDEARMLDIAGDIFRSLRSASHITDEIAGEPENALSYTSLLLQMNWLIRNLTEYSEIKQIESTIGDLVAELRTVEFTTETEPKQSTAPEGEEPPMGTKPSTGQEGAEPPMETEPPTGQEGEEPPAETEPPTSQEEGESATETEPPTDQERAEPLTETEHPSSQEGEESPSETDELGDTPLNTQNSQWKLEWGERLAALKAQISALPVYSGDETGDVASGILTESQVNLLQSYDRSGASEELDNMIRRYISEHNAIYSGILYLQSPYRSLAIFALALALAFDLSGFVFGFVAQGSEQGDQKAQNDQDTGGKNQSKTDTPNMGSGNPTDAGSSDIGERNLLKTIASDRDIAQQPQWSILETLNVYILLTGDYEYRDGYYVYTVFKDGVRSHWSVRDKEPYSQGIYIPETIDDDWSRGAPVSASEQGILLAAQAGGPQDGVYMDCRISFDDGSLILIRDGMKTFLANIDEYVPVHVYSPDRGENQTIPAKLLPAEVINASIAVVALNSKGTRVAVIYIIEQS